MSKQDLQIDGAEKQNKNTLSMSAQKKFTNVYLMYRDDMYWYIRKKVGTADIAEDLAADLFMKLLKKIS